MALHRANNSFHHSVASSLEHYNKNSVIVNHQISVNTFEMKHTHLDTEHLEGCQYKLNLA